MRITRAEKRWAREFAKGRGPTLEGSLEAIRRPDFVSHTSGGIGALTCIAKHLDKRREDTVAVLKWSVPVLISVAALIVSLKS